MRTHTQTLPHFFELQQLREIDTISNDNLDTFYFPKSTNSGMSFSNPRNSPLKWENLLHKLVRLNECIWHTVGIQSVSLCEFLGIEGLVGNGYCRKCT